LQHERGEMTPENEVHITGDTPYEAADVCAINANKLITKADKLLTLIQASIKTRTASRVSI
jgi:hypothetical protein